MQINTFLCPSDANNPGQAVTIGGTTGTPGSTNYPNNIGTFASEAATAGTVDGPAYYAGATAPMSNVVTHRRDHRRHLEHRHLQRVRREPGRRDSSDGTASRPDLPGHGRLGQDDPAPRCFTCWRLIAANCQAATPISPPATATFVSYDDGIKGIDWLFSTAAPAAATATSIRRTRRPATSLAAITAGHPTSTMVGASSYPRRRGQRRDARRLGQSSSRTRSAR